MAKQPTPGQAFVGALEALELTQRAFQLLLEHLAGEPLGNTTVNRWATDKRGVPPAVWAVIRLLERQAKPQRDRLYKEAGLA